MSDSHEDVPSNKLERQESWPRTIGKSGPSQGKEGCEANADQAPMEEIDVGTDRYLGQNSIPALLREQSSPTDKNDRVDIKQDMRSILGLDTSAPFPLMSSLHLQRLTQDIYTELPSDREVMKCVLQSTAVRV